jgi:hypothetical protein
LQNAETSDVNGIGNLFKHAAIIESGCFSTACYIFILRVSSADEQVQSMLLKPSGALGSFAAKARLGYLLRLYSRETLNDLLGLAEIRNIFAHGLPASFDSKEVRLLLNQIEIEGRLRKVRALKPVAQPEARTALFRQIMDHLIELLEMRTKAPAVFQEIPYPPHDPKGTN